MQVGGAQRRSMVPNVVLHSLGGAQRRSHKPRPTDRQKAMHKSPPCMSTGGLKYTSPAYK